jgi:EAL and modified HD-GYP domain-containing signal transduction protein
MGLRYKISSIRQALTIIGQSNLRKWVLILTMAKTVENKADELIKQAVYRARFCELLAEEAKMERDAPELFMTGMFSCIEAIMDDTLDNLLQNITLSNKIIQALKGEETPYYFLLALVLAFEKGDWDDVFSLSNKMKLNKIDLPKLHKSSIEFADSLSVIFH